MRTLSNRYIGITGFTTVEQIVEVETYFEQLIEDIQPEQSPWLMMGILVSSKTIRGEKNRWPNRYPEPEMLPELFRAAGAFDNSYDLVHFNTKNPEMLADECDLVSQACENLQMGFQLNIAWPDIRQVTELRHRQTARNSILLQIGGHALDSCKRKQPNGNEYFSSDVLASMVEPYSDLIDEVLLDPSGGLGIPLEPTVLCGPVRELMRFSDLGIGVAGGLSAKTVRQLIPPIASVCPYLSIDAEGRLRDDEDNLDIQKTKDYLAASVEILCKHPADAA